MILELVLILGLFAAGMTAIIRALVPMLWLLHKPLSCDLCMSWWGSLGGAVLWQVVEPQPLHLFVLSVPAAVAVSLVLIKTANRLSP